MGKYSSFIHSIIITKLLPNKYIIATVEESDTIRAKINLTLQNCKPHQDNLFKDEHKASKELKSDTSVVILTDDKGRSAIILKRWDYLEKCICHLNNGSYQLLKKDPATKLKPRH